jgi:hypothetical protein
MMAKEKKSAQELEAIILDRSLQAGMTLQSVAVYPSMVYGWEATYMAAPNFVMGYTSLFDGVVQQARNEFDLAE